MHDIKNEVMLAEKRIHHYVRQTPLHFSLALSRQTGMDVHLKYENVQLTGSFKVRGAFNCLLSLPSSQKEQGIVAASTGNHGAAVAYGLNKLALPGIIFVPENAASTKIENISQYEVPIKFHGKDCVETELFAKEYARKNNMFYLSPYNNLQVIAGQGTIGLEILNQLNDIDLVFVPVGGGGLIAGIAAYIKFFSPQTRLIGCLPANSAVMAESIKAGKIISMESLPTLSDATAGGIEPEAMTLNLCEAYVDEFIRVSEQEIESAIRTLIKTEHVLVEGAAGVALAALIKSAKQYENKKAAVILSGANISLDTLKKIMV